MMKVEVNASRSYDILIASSLLEQIGEHMRALHPQSGTVAIVTDENVRDLYLETVESSLKQAGFAVCSYAVPPGEISKSGTQYLALLEWLSENKITRGDVIVALGGGVVGDLTGFVAATHLRGVPYVQVPTSLLAMVDSSVGGKTAIDLSAGKNLAGAFYQPSLVLCDTDVIESLPKQVLHDGIAEVIKYGMIASDRLLDQLLNEPLAGNYDHIIAACVTIKRDIVQEDEFDRGERQLLNFGHTVGHAIELLEGYTMSHGKAVAIGMMIETRAAVRQNFAQPECMYLLESLLEHFDLPAHTDYGAEELYQKALQDKKRTGGEITLVIPYAIGKCTLKKIPVTELHDWIERGLEPCK